MVQFGYKPIQIGGLKYYHINANGTTQVSLTIGTLHAIIINTAGGAANTCTVVDSATANIPAIAVIDTTTGVMTLHYDLAFQTGLRIILATGTAADITVVYQD